MDWARYTGLTARTVVKRSAEAMVREAELRALQQMLGLKPDPPESALPPVEFESVSTFSNPQAAAKPVTLADIVDATRELEKSDAAYRERLSDAWYGGDPYPPRWMVPLTIPKTAKVKLESAEPKKPEPPKMAVGMKIRHLNDKESEREWFANEIRLTRAPYGDGYWSGVEVANSVSHWVIHEANWLKHWFPSDASLYPPQIYQRVAMSVDSGRGMLVDVPEKVIYATISHIKDDAFFAAIEDHNSSWRIANEDWLRRVWPVERGK